MIADEIIEVLAERLVQRITNANLFVIKKIARKIKEIGEILPSNAYDVMRALDYGGDLDEIVKELAKATQLNKKDIYEIFEEVAKNDQNFAKKYYDYKKKKFIPYDENELLRREVQALAELTAEKFDNMSKTRAIGYTVKEVVKGKDGKLKEKEVFKDVSTLYKDVVDEAIVSISEGKTNYDDEMGKLMKQIGRSGLKYLDYESGYHRRIDSAIRMNLNDGLKKLHNKTQEIFGREFDSDGVEVSVHNYPAPDHEQVQGRQFSTVKPSKNKLSEWEKFENDKDCYSYDGIFFPAVSEETGRDRRSISEYNCKHYTFAIILGVSKPQYTNEQLQKILDDNEKGFEYEGKHYTLYEGSQLQRRIETEIRRNKDIQIMGVESGNKELAEDSQRNINQLTQKYFELSKTSGLKPKLDRMNVEGYREIKVEDDSKNTSIGNPEIVKKWQDKFSKKYGSYDFLQGRVAYDKDKPPYVEIKDELKYADGELIDRGLGQLDKLMTKYKTADYQTMTVDIESKRGRFIAYTSYDGRRITLNNYHFGNKKEYIENEKRAITHNWHMKVKEENEDIYTMTHEFGHVLEAIYIENYKLDHDKYRSFVTREQVDSKIKDEILNVVQMKTGLKKKEIKDKYFSGYAKSKAHYEWFAETFAQMELGESNPLTEELKRWLKENL